MQTTSEAWKSLWASGAARLEVKAVIAGEEYADFPSPPVITRAAMQEGLSVGNAVSAMCALSLRTDAAIPKSAEVQIRMRLAGGDGANSTASEWLPAGTYYISRRSRDPITGVLTLECYDALLKANAVWTPSAGDWPRSEAAVVDELAALLGVALDDRTALIEGGFVREPVAGTAVRQALSEIAQRNGGNWIMTPGNRLRLAELEPAAGDEVEAAVVLGAIEAGEAGAVTGVRCTSEAGDALAGDDSGIVVDVTLAPVEAADLAERLVGTVYSPFALQRAVYDPAAELGDAVRYGGEALGTMFSEIATLGPAFRGDISAPVPAELADEYPYIGAASKALNVLKAQVQNLSETSVAGTTVLYASGASAIDPPADGWSATPPERREGMYLWQKIATLYADGRSETSDPVNISGADGEDATVLRIDSSRGTVFKNNLVSTTLSAVIYHGPDRITDMTALRRVFGVGAYLQWSWQRMGEDRYGVISSDDSRIGDGGFTFTLSPEDVDTKVTFMCELIVD